MAAHRPELWNENAVLDYYDQSECSMYRVYVGMVPSKQYCRYQWLDANNKPGGLENLRNALQAIQADKRNTHPYVLELISEIKEKQKGTKLVEQIESVNIGFKLNDDTFRPAGDNYQGGGGSSIILQQPGNSSRSYEEKIFEMMQEQNRKVLEQMQLMTEQINAREFIDDNDEDNDDDAADQPPPIMSGKQRIMGAIGSMLERPQVQSVIEMAILKYGASLMNGTNKQQ